MSTINVDLISPSAANTVNVNGVKISGNATSLNVGNYPATPLGSTSVHVGIDSGNVTLPAAGNNVTVGYYSGAQLSTGNSNTFVGAFSGQLLTAGIQNTFMGKNAGKNAQSSSNTCIGDNAGEQITTGGANTFLGSGAGNPPFLFTGSQSTCVGHNSFPSSASASYEFTLGDINTSTLRCAVTSITSLSDARDKKDVAELSAGLDFVKTLKPVEFVWNTRDGAKKDIKDFGFIAQDLKKAQEDIKLEETLKLVYESNPEKLEASYGKLIPILVKAIQDLSAKVEALEAKKK